jgi:four helix bundle protein
MDENRGKIRDYRDLIVWKEAIDLAERVYVLTRPFPKEELFGLTSQMRRCATSIPANVAEGFGRQQRRSFVQFLRIAQGSLKELESHAILSGRLGLLDAKALAEIELHCETLGKRLVSFVRSLEKSKGPS